MDLFHVLVVDDDDSIVSKAKSIEIEGVQIHTATNVDDAMAIIGEFFLRASFIDLQLQPKDRNADGAQILRNLAKLRPTSLRVLLTQHVEGYRRAFFGLIDPHYPLIHGAIDKGDFNTGFDQHIRSLAKTWSSGRDAIDVGGDEGCYSNLEKKLKSRKLTIEPSHEEFRYLIRKMFSVSDIHNLHQTEETVRALDVRSLVGGWSTSVVMHTKPNLIGDAQGIELVVKVGFKDDLAMEYMNYEKYVKYSLSLNRRVELFRYESGDTLGGIVYSFAGRAPKTVSPLSEYIASEDRRALFFIDQLFDPASLEWYSFKHVIPDLGSYFSETYGLDPVSVFKRVSEFGQSLDKKHGLVFHDDQIGYGSKDALTIDSGIIGHGFLRHGVQGCIVHGDLHADNVITDGEDRAVLIDYRYTGVGPAALDAAAMLVSMRLSSCRSQGLGFHDILSEISLEATVLEIGLFGKPASSDLKDIPYWADVSIHILAGFRNAFNDEIEPREILATCFLASLRVLRITKVPDKERLALLVWAMALTRAIRKIEG